jgi:hypothetical protein
MSDLTDSDVRGLLDMAFELLQRLKAEKQFAEGAREFIMRPGPLRWEPPGVRESEVWAGGNEFKADAIAHAESEGYELVSAIPYFYPEDSMLKLFFALHFRKP